MQAGKAFEYEALGGINKKKEGELTLPLIIDLVRKEMYPGYDLETIERLHAAHPEEKEFFDKKVKSRYGQEFAHSHNSLVVDEEKAVLIVKGAQPRERAPLADDLYNTVALNLGLEEVDENEDYVDLKYYTAVGSKLDFVFGVDCFAVYSYLDNNTNKRKEAKVTIDVTLNPDKIQSKADLVLHFYEDTADKRSNWKALVEQYGREITLKIKEKIRESN